MKNYHIFWGGEDISPHFYNETKSRYCGHNNIPRDTKEITLAYELIDKQIPLIGICRGAQLLNVVNGGKLLQHIDGHAISRMHDITTYNNKILYCTSTHHQMMVPTKDAEILAVSNGSVMGIANPDTDKFEEIEKVYEVLYYPKTKCFCIQGHPEWMSNSSDFVQWLKEEIKNKLNIDITFSDDSIYYGKI